MSIEEAKKVTATFTGASFVPPPRTINDITAILDQQKRSDPEVSARRQADATPPSTTDRATLAEFYFKRGRAAEEIGRAKQEIDDLTKALEYTRRVGYLPTHEILDSLASAELRGGNASRFIEYRHEAIKVVPNWSRVTWRLGLHSSLATHYASFGDLSAAEAELAETSRLFHQSLRVCVAGGFAKPGECLSACHVHFAEAQAALLEAKGKHAEAEALYRKSVAVLAGDPVNSRDTWLDREHWYLARTLIRQGRLLEAENEARKALLGALAKR